MGEVIRALRVFQNVLINQDGPVSPIPMKKLPSKKKKVQRSFLYFLMLPYELQCEIIKFVGFSDICTLQRTSKALKQLASENLVWKAIYQNHFGASDEALETYGSFVKQWQSHFKIQHLLLQQKYIQSEKISCESKPPARFAHTGVVHNGHVYYIGGQMEETRSDEIWDYSAQTNAFQKVPISNYSENNGALFNENNYDCYNFPGINGTVPKFARHQSVIVGDKVYSFGGYDYTYFYNLAVFDINEKTWTYVKVKGDVPLSRSNHASSVVGSKIYIFGGSIGDNADKYTVTNDFYCLDTETLTWSKLDCEGTPSIRVGHAMATIGKEIYLFGGGVWGKDLGWTDQNNDLYVFSTEKKKWSLINLKPEDKPGVCTYPFIFTFHSNLFVFGGASITGITVTNKLYMWDVILRKWTDMTVVGEEISPRSIGTSSVIGDEVILLGGYCGGLLDSAEDFFKLKFNFPRLGCIGMS